MGNSYYVYLYLRSEDSKNGVAGSPYYVGKGKGIRAFKPGRKFRPAKENTWIWQEGLSEDDALLEECRLILMYGRIDNGTGILRNLTDGGEGISGLIATPERRRKIGEAHKGRPHTEEQNRKLSETRKAMHIKMTPEQLKAHAERSRGRKLSVEAKAAIGNANRGRKHPPRSAEYLAALSERMKTFRLTGEQRNRATAALKGRKFSPEHRAAISAAKKGKPSHTPEQYAAIGEKLKHCWKNQYAQAS